MGRSLVGWVYVMLVLSVMSMPVYRDGWVGEKEEDVGASEVVRVMAEEEEGMEERIRPYRIGDEEEMDVDEMKSYDPLVEPDGGDGDAGLDSIAEEVTDTTSGVSAEEEEDGKAEGNEEAEDAESTGYNPLSNEDPLQGGTTTTEKEGEELDERITEGREEETYGESLHRTEGSPDMRVDGMMTADIGTAGEIGDKLDIGGGGGGGGGEREEEIKEGGEEEEEDGEEEHSVTKWSEEGAGEEDGNVEGVAVKEADMSLPVPVVEAVRKSITEGFVALVGHGFLDRPGLICRHVVRNEVALAMSSTAKFIDEGMVLCELPSDLFVGTSEGTVVDVELSNDGVRFSEPISYDRTVAGVVEVNDAASTDRVPALGRVQWVPLLLVLIAITAIGLFAVQRVNPATRSVMDLLPLSGTFLRRGVLGSSCR